MIDYQYSVCIVCAPVFHLNEGVIGVPYMWIIAALSNAFSEADQTFLQAFANLVGVALVNARMYEQLEEKAQYLQQEVERQYQLDDLVGQSDAMQSHLPAYRNALQRAIFPCLCKAKQVRAKNWLRVPYTTIVHAKTGHFCRKIVPASFTRVVAK